jgi:hypothetical protein
MPSSSRGKNMLKLTTKNGPIYIQTDQIQAIQQQQESTTIVTRSNYTFAVEEKAEDIYTLLETKK